MNLNVIIGEKKLEEDRRGQEIVTKLKNWNLTLRQKFLQSENVLWIRRKKNCQIKAGEDIWTKLKKSCEFDAKTNCQQSLKHRKKPLLFVCEFAQKSRQIKDDLYSVDTKNFTA